MQTNVKILTVNIPEELSENLLTSFSDNQHTISMVENLYSQATMNMLIDHNIVLVQTDNDLYSPEQLSIFCRSNPAIEMIGVVRDNNSDNYKFIQAGLFDVLTYNCSYDELMTTLLKAINRQKNKAEISHLKQYVAMNFGFDNLIGESKQILQLKEKIKKVSPTDISVLLSGPSGSGKSLTAKIMHHHSERRKQSFVSFSASSTPKTMIDSELFGDINSSEPSLLEKADNGTLYIKDVHSLPLTTQKKFVQFMQTNQLDTMQHHKKLSIRFISSTNINITSLVNSHAFDKDLYHLLGELTVSIPHLKDRLNDIELLSEYFARLISHETERPTYTFSRSALELMYNHHWTENVRELENIIKRATSLCRSSQIDESDILFIESAQSQSTPNRFTVDMSSDQGNGILDEGQRSLIIKTLDNNNWNYTQTAIELGIGRTTLWRKVKKYNLKKESAELV